jgi:23S rRNA (uracil1939-C5)-methyltransferase
MVADDAMKVEKLVYGGAGLGRVGGRVHLLPFVLPGESVKLEPVKHSKDVVQARLTEIVEPSPARIAPKCPYFTRCGGCDYQHAGYEFQLDQKRAILTEVLRRVGKIDPPDEIAVVSGPPWEYRNRTRFHLHRGEIGYLEAGTHRLCPVEECPISSPKINETLGRLRALLSQPWFSGRVREIELFTDEAQVQLNVIGAEGPPQPQLLTRLRQAIPDAVYEPIHYQAAGEVYRVSRNSFFQVNRYLIDRLVETALETAQGETAIDAYAGVGLFSLPLARRFHSVRSIEGHESAARDLASNVQRSGLAIETVHQPVELFLDSLAAPPGFLLLDPPRAGLGPRVVRQLCRIRPPRVTIVSCDPATLARDLAALIAGGYRLDKMTLVDLFPQTYHIEAVAHLALAG